MEKLQLAIVMPVFNEEEAIANVINKWTKELQKLRINFKIHAYNDGSIDNTLQILNHLASENKNLIVHDKLNTGHGPTIIQGYRENSDVEWIFQTDSDDEIGSEMFEDLWKKRHKYHFLVGRRKSLQRSLTRKLISSISRLIVRIFYGNRVYDVNAAYRLMRSKQFKDLFFALPDNLFAPNVIISGFASIKKLDVYEAPVRYNKRTKGKTSIKKMKLLKAALKSAYQTIMYRFKLMT